MKPRQYKARCRRELSAALKQRLITRRQAKDLIELLAKLNPKGDLK